MEKNNIKSEDYFPFLEALRESGKINMFGAAEYLRAVFPELEKDRLSYKVLEDWMNSYINE